MGRRRRSKGGKLIVTQKPFKATGQKRLASAMAGFASVGPERVLRINDQASMTIRLRDVPRRRFCSSRAKPGSDRCCGFSGDWVRLTFHGGLS